LGERADLVIRQFEAIERGDLEEVVSVVSEDFEFINPDYALEPGIRRGREGARRAFANLLEAFDGLRWKLEDLTEQGDRVIVTGSWSGHGKGSGAEFTDQPFGVVVTFGGNEVRRFEWFNRTDEAVAAFTSEASRAGGP
jgi:ketosteroid isomerase-like protein